MIMYALLVAVALLFTGCQSAASNGEKTNAPPAATPSDQAAANAAQAASTPATATTADPKDGNKPEPLELKIWYGAPATDEQFEHIQGLIQTKYPHIHLVWQNKINPTWQYLQQLVIAKESPDLVIASMLGMKRDVMENGLEFDMSELAKKYNVDMSVFEPSYVEGMNMSANGKLYGLPFSNSGGFVLFYNKAIFDQFGVPYPTDDMTWDDTFEIAKSITRSESDVNYVGMGISPFDTPTFNSLSAPVVDYTAVN